MKHIASIILASILSLIVGPYLPWWSMVIAPFIAGLIFQFKSLVHFVLGFASIFCLWGIQAFLASQNQAADLVIRIGQLFEGLAPILLILISAFIGGLYGGLAQLSGHLLKTWLSHEK